MYLFTTHFAHSYLNNPILSKPMGPLIVGSGRLKDFGVPGNKKKFLSGMVVILFLTFTVSENIKYFGNGHFSLIRHDHILSKYQQWYINIYIYIYIYIYVTLVDLAVYIFVWLVTRRRYV